MFLKSEQPTLTLMHTRGMSASDRYPICAGNLVEGACACLRRVLESQQMTEKWVDTTNGMNGDGSPAIPIPGSFGIVNDGPNSLPRDLAVVPGTHPPVSQA